MNTARSEEAPTYTPAMATSFAEERDDEIIALARAILSARCATGDVMASPANVRAYLQLRLSPLEREAFAVMFLNAQNQLIETEEMFRGTLTQTSVYPREVVKAALRHNAGAVILAHNHPSGIAEPSRADEQLTATLKAALAMVDVRVLDHVVVAARGTVSFAERGLL